jgi:acylphosphatase
MPSDPLLEMKSIHMMVDGHVQGVGFRYFVYDYANSKGLTGWVRNRIDGQVEITAEGPYGDLDALLEHVRRGPGRSMVTDVKFEWYTTQQRYDKFMLLPTE